MQLECLGWIAARNLFERSICKGPAPGRAKNRVLNAGCVILSVLVLAGFASPLAAQQSAGGNKPTTLSDLGCGPDEIARVNADDEWECSGALTAVEDKLPVAFTVLDSSDQEVGRVITTFSRSAHVLLEISSDRRVILQANESGIVDLRNVFFETPDCSGTPWIIKESGFQPASTPFSTLPTNLGRSLYVATGSPPLEIQIQSTLTSLFGGAATCEPFGGTRELLPAELVDPDLHSTFPPPYRLVIK